jgi:predicted  nucleic acid-binding Zn-ribbon protein
MNQSDDEAKQLTEKADDLFRQSIELGKESERMSNECIRLANASKESLFGRSKLLAEAKQFGDKGKRLLADSSRLREEGEKLLLLAKSKKMTAHADTNQPLNNFVTCRCQHCDCGIEFDANELTDEGCIVPCPHCGLQTHLKVPKSPSQQITKKSQLEEVDEEVRNLDRLKTLEEAANRIVVYSQLDTLKLEGDCVKIHRRGIANALAAGLNGERTILISSLTSVQMKPAAWLSPGYILFSYAGSKPFMGGLIDATQDPDAFIFGQESNGKIAEFKMKVEEKMREARRPAPTAISSGGLPDEIRQLAALKQQGLLSQEEFEAAKKKLLS